MALRKNYTGIVNKKTFKNEPTKICGRQPLKKLKGMVCFKQTIPTHFTWFILEYFVSNILLSENPLKYTNFH